MDTGATKPEHVHAVPSSHGYASFADKIVRHGFIRKVYGR